MRPTANATALKGGPGELVQRCEDTRPLPQTVGGSACDTLDDHIRQVVEGPESSRGRFGYRAPMLTPMRPVIVPQPRSRGRRECRERAVPV